MDDVEAEKLTLFEACAINTLNMFGTGPFITIPFLIAAAPHTPGPHALIGYALAAFACIMDSFIWAELGALWPQAGGSYNYLRECYGRDTWGRPMAFLFVWQFMISAPMEVASGFVAVAQYMSYITNNSTYWHHAGIAFAIGVVTTVVLYRGVRENAKISVFLWAITISAILFTLIAGFREFNPEYLATPKGAFKDPTTVFMALGVCARYGIYDFTGYFDINFIGNVRNPQKVIPLANIITCVVVALIYFLVYLAVCGYLPWDGADGYVHLVESDADASNYIMALFSEKLGGRDFAIFFVLVVVITIFASVFALLLGYASVPFAAARNGDFFGIFGHEHAKHAGLADYALIFMGFTSLIFCFFELEIIIEGMLTMRLLAQFIAQTIGLMIYSYKNGRDEFPYKMPLYPLPCIIQMLIFFYVFITTENYIWDGGAPLLEFGIIFLLMGMVVYFFYARYNQIWPWQDDNQARELSAPIDDEARELKGAREQSAPIDDGEIEPLKAEALSPVALGSN